MSRRGDGRCYVELGRWLTRGQGRWQGGLAELRQPRRHHVQPSPELLAEVLLALAPLLQQLLRGALLPLPLLPRSVALLLPLRPQQLPFLLTCSPSWGWG
jgi:hypothetical protein